MLIILHANLISYYKRKSKANLYTKNTYLHNTLFTQHHKATKMQGKYLFHPFKSTRIRRRDMHKHRESDKNERLVNSDAIPSPGTTAISPSTTHTETKSSHE